MAFISKKDLIENLNPLIEELVNQADLLQDKATDEDDEELDAICDEFSGILTRIQSEIDKAAD